MQRRIDDYLVRRKIVREFMERVGMLVFHGTSSRALPSINRHGAVLPPSDLERVGIYAQRTSRARYEDIRRGSRDIRDHVVSVTDDPSVAYIYAVEDRLSRLRDSNYLENLYWDLFTVRQEYRGVSMGWPSHFAFSNIKAFLPMLRKGYHNVRDIPHFPVVVAVPAPNAPYLQQLDEKIRAEPRERGLVQIPAHMAFFFVPDERLADAKKLLWRYKHRVLPISLLYRRIKRK
ncbi:MAG: hypothetical protein PWP76_445 [Candidatus Diapherotrites archaeon]|nr:hypothetical protein [Candidatus Diapherotrites archaeon]